MGDVSDESETARKPKRRIKLLLIVASVVLVLDVVTKVLAVRLLQPGKPVPIIGDTVTWTLVRNSGRRVLVRHGLYLGAHPHRHLGGGGNPVHRSSVGLDVVGNRLGHDSRRCTGQSRGQVLPRPGTAARPRGGLPVRGVVAGLQCRGPSVVGGAILLVALSLFGYDYDREGRSTSKPASSGPEDSVNADPQASQTKPS